ncbi:hypothetical protein L6R52_13900 [Myxococcota bacterium]|nr:hypothetical protein [Myxococcota bacterium]
MATIHRKLPGQTRTAFTYSPRARRGAKASARAANADTFTREDAPARDVARRADPAALPAVGRASRVRSDDPGVLDLRARLRRLEATRGVPIELEATEIAGVPIKRAKKVRFLGLAEKSPAATSTSIVAELGVLDRASFDRVHAALGGLSKVPFVDGRRWELTDFLPPKLQALLGRDLVVPTIRTIPGSETWDVLPRGEPKTVDLTMNCHATAYEVLRAYQGDDESVSIFFGDPLAMDALADEGYLTTVARADDPAALKDLSLRPGDLLELFEPVGADGPFRATHLVHSAVHVGAGLFIEKADTEVRGKDFPYRLATLDQVVQPIADLLDGAAPRAAILRAELPLPEPEHAFGASVARDVARWERDHHQRVGMPLARAIELEEVRDPAQDRTAAGITGEWLTAIDVLPLGVTTEGRGTIAPR